MQRRSLIWWYRWVCEYGRWCSDDLLMNEVNNQGGRFEYVIISHEKRDENKHRIQE